MAFGLVLAQDAPTPAATVDSPPTTESMPAIPSFPPASRGRGSPTTTGGARGGRGSNAKPLDENVTITIKGTVAKDIPVDISFTGCGPNFSLSKHISDVELNGTKQPIDCTCEITIAPVNAAYRIEYTVGCRIPVVNSNYTNAGTGGVVTGTVSYTNVSTSSTLILKMGQTISAANSDDQSLTISLSKPAP